MTELNKQWYEGTLKKDKYYYAKDSSEGDCIVHINKSNEMTFTGWEVPYEPDQSNVLEPFKLRTELLAEVPDYVELRNMVNCACEEHEANHRLLEENAQLKEMLKECKKSFQELSIGYKYGIAGEIADEMLQKIDEVLK